MDSHTSPRNWGLLHVEGDGAVYEGVCAYLKNQRVLYKVEILQPGAFLFPK